MKRIRLWKIAKIALLAVMAVPFGILCFLTAEGVIVGLWDIPEMINWRAKTSPLDPVVVQDLCTKLSLPDEDRRCQPGATVYAPDFFGDITSEFRAKDGVWATYDQVQDKIGKYQFAFDPLVAGGNGYSYFRAHYDLRGDRVYPITMFFYEDGRVYRIIADVGD